MKLIHSILLLPLIGSACSPTHSTRYIIEGEGVDSTLNGKYLYLQRYDDRSIIDSAQVVKQRYVFHGDIDTAVYCYIDTKSWSTVQFMLEPWNHSYSHGKPEPKNRRNQHRGFF